MLFLSHIRERERERERDFLMKKSTKASLKEMGLKGVGDLIKHLPSGTVFLFQFLSPLLTNNGHCTLPNKILSGALLFVCSFSCCFSCFTDSYIDPADGKLYYGVATYKGLWLFSDDPNSGSPASKDPAMYRLRFGDFVHAALSLLVFAAIAVLDENIVSCYYPSMTSSEQGSTLLEVLPTVVGVFSASVFVIFPSSRNQIGYPPKDISATDRQ